MSDTKTVLEGKMKRRDYLKFMGLSTAAMLSGCVGISQQRFRDEGEMKQPNIVLIMTDDMGYECLGAYGCVSYKTPVLDEMARTGVRFDHCYSQPLCTPSRVQIMTGQYNNRNYTQWGVLPPTEKTFGHMMQEAGYVTACAGKWQLSGGAGENGTNVHDAGFDEACMWAYGFDLEAMGFELKHPKGADNNYYYNPANPEERYNVVDKDRPHMTSRYWYPGLVKNRKLVPTTFNDYGPDICCDFIVDFIDRNHDKAFFAYYPMILTHGPNNPTPDTPGAPSMSNEEKFTSSRENFKYLVEYSDKLVGRVLKKLDKPACEKIPLLYSRVTTAR